MPSSSLNGVPNRHLGVTCGPRDRSRIEQDGAPSNQALATPRYSVDERLKLPWHLQSSHGDFSFAA